MIGTRVSHYNVVRSLGAGGMGIVYEAEDLHLGRRVALKFLPPALSTTRNRSSGFSARRAPPRHSTTRISARSMRLSSTREHFIVMELLEGQTLAQLLSARGFEVLPAARAAIQIADALESAHAKGIVHRDIKPAKFSSRRAAR